MGDLISVVMVIGLIVICIGVVEGGYRVAQWIGNRIEKRAIQ